jgi:hypothetical protein
VLLWESEPAPCLKVIKPPPVAPDILSKGSLLDLFL